MTFKYFWLEWKLVIIGRYRTCLDVQVPLSSSFSLAPLIKIQFNFFYHFLLVKLNSFSCEMRKWANILFATIFKIYNYLLIFSEVDRYIYFYITHVPHLHYSQHPQKRPRGLDNIARLNYRSRNRIERVMPLYIVLAFITTLLVYWKWHYRDGN